MSDPLNFFKLNGYSLEGNQVKRIPTAVPDSTQHLLPPTTLPNIQTPQPNIIRITHWVPHPQDTLPDKLLEVCTTKHPEDLLLELL